MQALQGRGVRIESAALVADVDKDGVVLKDGRRILSATVVWAAGVRANPLADCFPATGSRGRVIVGPTLQVERHPEVFVVGDSAAIPGRRGALPMLAQVAIQSGRHAAHSVLALSTGGTVTAFRYRDLGTTAVLGRGDAVAQIGRVHLSGLSGWLAWLAVHLAQANSWQTKATVLLDWVSGLVFTDRPVRLITRPTVQATPADAGARRPGARAEPASATAFAKADLPSVNVSNTHRWGRVAALAWWSQDYPGLRSKPPRQKGMAALRRRVVRLRHALTGDKASAED
jgi:NADH dehydrogenase